jgi:peptidoglycan-N-acetylglucosamine deacetylase
MIALTFDNLGEAAEINLGGWDDDRPRGEHPSVTQALPEVLAALAERRLCATFFVEGLNTELYPDALRAIADTGHEIGYHAWCHEEFGALDAGAAAENLRRGAEALAGLGLAPRGFRPPGGALPDGGETAVREAGFRWCSPEGDEPAAGAVARLPFRWPLVDAYWLLPQFAARRDGEGIERFEQEVGRALAAGGWVDVICHPFLWLDPAIRDAELRVLDRLAEHEVLTMSQVAERLG